jgi:hypothetical protein
MKKTITLTLFIIITSLSAQYTKAQTKIKAFGFNLNVPTGWKTTDNQKDPDFAYVNMYLPERASEIFVDVNQITGSSAEMVNTLTMQIRNSMRGIKMNINGMTDEVIADKLQSFASESGQQFLTFEHWDRNNPDKKQRYVLVFIARSGEGFTVFTGREISTANAIPAYYKIIRNVLENAHK